MSFTSKRHWIGMKFKQKNCYWYGDAQAAFTFKSHWIHIQVQWKAHENKNFQTTFTVKRHWIRRSFQWTAYETTAFYTIFENEAHQIIWSLKVVKPRNMCFTTMLESEAHQTMFFTAFLLNDQNLYIISVKPGRGSVTLRVVNPQYIYQNSMPSIRN